MRVSICDDLPEAIDDLKEKLSHFPDITAIDTFTDLNEFAKRIKKVRYDICFMLHLIGCLQQKFPVAPKYCRINGHTRK